MLAKQRQDKIYEMIRINGAVDVSQLVKLFGVSIETIRKDLLFMENSGMLKRVHGGAIKVNEMKKYEVLRQRNTENIDLKKELSIKAAEFVNEGDFIAIDAGSTAIIFAEVLKQRFNKLTIVTHNKDVFDLLCDYADFNVILCAGHYLKEENTFFGDYAINTLKQLHVQKAFVFPSAISMKHGVFDFQIDLFSVQKELLNCADKIYILADSSKFERTGLLKLCDICENYTFITDNALPAELKKAYINNDIDIY